MGGGKAPQRNLYAETSDELKAKADLAPRVYATEAEFSPKYTALELQGLEQSLLGTPGGTKQLDYVETVTKYRNPLTGEMSDSPRTTSGSSAIGTNRDGSTRYQTTQWEQVQVPVNRSRTVSTPAQKGIVDIGEQIAGRIAQVDSKNLSAQREADIGDVNRLGGLSLAAQQNADPRTAALIEGLTSDATDELGMGYDMSPAQMRLAQQSVRARGQGTFGNIGPSGDLREAIGVSKFAQDLRNQRRDFATRTVALRQGTYGDSFNRVLGRSASASPQSYLGTAGGLAKSAGPTMFGSSINANELYSDNQNAAAANNAARSSANQAYAGAGIGAGASILAAVI